MRILLIIVISLFFTFCKKKKEQIIEGSMTVIRGCEGTYLRLNDLDYTICNEGMLDKYENGKVIKAELINTKNCVSNRGHCTMVHSHSTADGRYEVTKVN